MAQVRGWVLKALLAQMIIAAAVLHGSRLIAQSQETLNERVRLIEGELDRRVANLERFDIDGRLRVVESDMHEVKWMGRSVAVTVAGQLVLLVVATKRQSRG